jgi:hypothetical protein
MTLCRKFAKVAGAGLLGLSLLAAAGCATQMPQQQQAAAETSQGIYADACLVVDHNAGQLYTGYNAYDFRIGILLLSTTAEGDKTPGTAAVPLSSLNESGKARALEMYNKLPASAHCEAPKPR